MMTIKELLAEKAPNEGVTQTGIADLQLVRISEPLRHAFGVLPPSLCLAATGTKSVYFGDKEYRYGNDKFLLGSANVPVRGELAAVSKKKPYLGLAISISVNVIAELLLEYSPFEQSATPAEELIAVGQLAPSIAEPLVRLLRIVGDEQDEKILGRQIIREIMYQVLKSPSGPVLRNCAAHHASAHRIAPIIQSLQARLQDDISIEELAKRAAMSPSRLHEFFKKTTGLSPLQYVKRLRLNHAHELLLTGASVSDAAMGSGYNSATQFSREFKRLFLVSPSEVRLRP